MDAYQTGLFGMQITPETTSKAVPETDKVGGFWDADQIVEERILTPETIETPLQCKEDHHNSIAPADVPGLEALVYRDAAALAACWAGMPGVAQLPATDTAVRVQR